MNRNRFRLIKHFGIFRLTEIKPVMQLLQNNQFSTLQSTSTNILFQFVDIGGAVSDIRLLHQSDL